MSKQWSPYVPPGALGNGSLYTSSSFASTPKIDLGAPNSFASTPKIDLGAPNRLSCSTSQTGSEQTFGCSYPVTSNFSVTGSATRFLDDNSSAAYIGVKYSWNP